MTETTLLDLSTAFGFAVGQGYTLERIRNEFPHLRARVRYVELLFDKSFGASLSAMDSVGRDVLEGSWATAKLRWRDEMVRVMPTVLTQDQAISFLEEVERRADGFLPDGILSTLLIFTPEYRSQPVAEMRDGYTSPFRTDGTRKSRGVRLQLEYPTSWTSQPGKRPHVLALLQSEAGRGLEYITILIREEVGVPPDFKWTRKDYEIILADPADMAPEGFSYRDGGLLSLDGLPGAYLEFVGTQQYLDMILATRMVEFITFHGNKGIIIMGGVAGLPSEEAQIKAAYNRFRPLFAHVAGSLVIESRW